VRIGSLAYPAKYPLQFQDKIEVWLLKLGGRWVKASAQCTSKSVVLSDCENEIKGGMSGSPIVTTTIGVICTGEGW